MGADRLAEAEVDWHGVEGDRQYSLYRKEDLSRFPWLSGRDLPDLVRYKAVFREPEFPRRSAVEIVSPDGAVFDLHDPALLGILSNAAGSELGILQLGRGTYDSMPVSIATTAAHDMLDDIHGETLDRRRFRSNIVIHADVSPTEWLSRRLIFGEGRDGAEVLVTNSIPRCSVITIDPDTGRRDPRVMRNVAQSFANDFGVYGTPSRVGRVRIGDPVFVIG
jgi:uncharacterized protein YcbX